MSSPKASIELSLSTLMQLLALAGLIVSGTVAIENIKYEIDNLQRDNRRLSAQVSKLEKDVQLFAQIMIEENKDRDENKKEDCKNEQI
jgi:outer membrane murein-binding lipoprotein Lpp